MSIQIRQTPDPEDRKRSQPIGCLLSFLDAESIGKTYTNCGWRAGIEEEILFQIAMDAGAKHADRMRALSMIRRNRQDVLEANGLIMKVTARDKDAQGRTVTASTSRVMQMAQQVSDPLTMPDPLQMSSSAPFSCLPEPPQDERQPAAAPSEQQEGESDEPASPDAASEV
jgi:hypothetical protein